VWEQSLHISTNQYQSAVWQSTSNLLWASERFHLPALGASLACYVEDCLIQKAPSKWVCFCLLLFHVGSNMIKTNKWDMLVIQTSQVQGFFAQKRSLVKCGDGFFSASLKGDDAQKSVLSI
jgi:hypothetical protein